MRWLLLFLIAHFIWHLPVPTWLWWIAGIITGLNTLGLIVKAIKD